PDAPSGLSAAVLSSTSIQLTWTDNSGDETGFKIDRRESGTDPWVRVGTPSANGTSHTDSGLAAGTKYYYKVMAANAAGDSPYSNVADATTQAEVPPPSIAVSTTSVSVSGEAGQNAASATFQVWNGGAGTLAYNVVETTSKLSVAPASGTSTGSGDKQTHTITFTTADLAAGTYDRTITVEDNGSGAANGPITIAVHITVTEPSTTRTVEARVAAGSDDAEEATAGGAVYVDSSDLELIRDGTNEQVVGVRFAGLAVPWGAAIEAAYVQFKVDEASSETTSLTIRGEKTANAQPFTTAAKNISGRVTTAASAAWSPAAWSAVGAAGAAQRTADLRAVVQEVVNHKGWASGNALALVITGTGVRVAEAYEGDAAGAALLHVEYSPGLPVEDGDGDAMSDEWELENFGGTNAPNSGAQDDKDGDGYSNLAEYIAGTDPSGSASSLFAVNMTLSGGAVVVSFPTVEAAGPGYEGLSRYYSLESASAAGEEAVWSGVAGRTNILGTGQTVSYTAPSGPMLFYRGKVWLAEN
ncbi:MAG: fibronectin type III domain-containing protein, partial [Kiritimatiellae bacterium]|nr:fibronectin type III domain-containing protein [Kiritimatiellia bacterium]